MGFNKDHVVNITKLWLDTNHNKIPYYWFYVC